MKCGPSSRRSVFNARELWLFTAPGEQPSAAAIWAPEKVVVVAKYDNRALPWRENPKRRQHHQTVSDAADTIGAAVLVSRLNQSTSRQPSRPRRIAACTRIFRT